MIERNIFNSAHECFEYSCSLVEQYKSGRRRKYSSSTSNGSSKMSRDWDDWVRIFNEGWKLEGQELTFHSDEFFKRKFKQAQSYTGNRINIAGVCCNADKQFFKIRREVVKNEITGTVIFNIDTPYNLARNPRNAVEYARFIYSKIMAYSMPVKIVAYSINSETPIWVDLGYNNSNMNKKHFMLTLHPSFLRRTMFAIAETDKDLDAGYGSVRDATAKEIQKRFGNTPVVMLPNMSKWYSMGLASRNNFKIEF